MFNFLSINGQPNAGRASGSVSHAVFFPRRKKQPVSRFQKFPAPVRPFYFALARKDNHPFVFLLLIPKTRGGFLPCGYYPRYPPFFQPEKFFGHLAAIFPGIFKNILQDVPPPIFSFCQESAKAKTSLPITPLFKDNSAAAGKFLL
jgi:hypothetical protein